jgi:hypothetical protein
VGGSVEDVLLPSVVGSRAVGLAVVALVVWTSVALGREGTAGRRRRLDVLATIAVAGVTVAALAHLDAPIPSLLSPTVAPVSPYLQQADGTPITDICPYARDGTLLEGVLLFDQNRRPIQNVAPEGTWEPPAQESVARIPNAYPIRRATPALAGPSPDRSRGCPSVALPGAAATPAAEATPAPAATR